MTSGMLRVGFDDQIFQAQRRGGISKYFVELFERLPGAGIEPVILSTRTRNLHLAESGLVPRSHEPGRVAERLEWISWRATGRPRTTPRPLPAFDVIHHTFTHGSYLSLPFAGPRVVTIFDMTPELFPSYFRLGNPHFQKRRYSRVCDAVIAISQNTLDDVERIYGDTAPAQVIPFGVGEGFFARRSARLELPAEYLLFVGVRAGYKDFTVAFEAFRALAAERPRLRLVVVGGGEFSVQERGMIDAVGLTARVVRLAPSDDDMPEIYRRAHAFLFPSRYEGFGLPTLEALASGTPTVLADASCSREVGGEAASYFPPGDVDALIAQIRLSLSPGEQARVEKAGPRHARTFRWEAVAETTANLYRSLAESGRSSRRR